MVSVLSEHQFEGFVPFGRVMTRLPHWTFKISGLILRQESKEGASFHPPAFR